ncbi:hypothetical protein BJ138DRAFT_1165861 [Hygrophoropsis aurantiaca]|uniref:Uncharacterized protein n=1 Tax=Hygrophoropsis aurantiaca TaxID=72124 RepID=A0ACB7ZUK3_9AGAM|nr:hypothetical protein BJ138DRAFT_1165861 [Hygrophoropsis aurantiaca]
MTTHQTEPADEGSTIIDRLMPLSRKHPLKGVIITGDQPHPAHVSVSRVAASTIEQNHLAEVVSTTTNHTLHYAVNVVGSALRKMKIPLSLILFLWLLGLLNAHIAASLLSAFSPLPGISRSTLCAPRTYKASPSEIKWPDFSALVEVQSSTLEHLLDKSIGGLGLSLEMTQAEMATRDLTLLVRNSDLKTSNILGDLLANFAKDAKSTARGLTRFSSKVGGVVDEITAINDYAVRTIQEARSSAPSPYSLRMLLPSWNPATRKIILDVFIDAMGTMSRQIERLILEAEVSLANLNELDEDLSAIHEILSRDDQYEKVEKDELLAELWTRLGGNRRIVGQYNHRLKLLKDLGEYRKRALAHVTGAIHTLRSMDKDIENLRERVAAPEVRGGQVPLDVHITSIQHGLERLKECRVEAKQRGAVAMKTILGTINEQS